MLPNLTINLLGFTVLSAERGSGEGASRIKYVTIKPSGATSTMPSATDVL